jgi:hypothetical protein
VGVAVGGDLTGSGQRHGHEAGVAGQGECLLDADEGAVAGAGESGAGCGLLLGHGEHDGGGDAVAGREFPGAQHREQRVLQAVVVALSRRAGITGAILDRCRFGHGVQDGQQGFGADRGQLGLEVGRAVAALPHGGAPGAADGRVPR